MPRFEVIVENIGTVYDGTDEDKAYEMYGRYMVKVSEDSGRIGESVALFEDGHLVKEYWKE